MTNNTIQKIEQKTENKENNLRKKKLTFENVEKLVNKNKNAKKEVKIMLNDKEYFTFNVKQYISLEEYSRMITEITDYCFYDTEDEFMEINQMYIPDYERLFIHYYFVAYYTDIDMSIFDITTFYLFDNQYHLYEKVVQNISDEWEAAWKCEEDVAKTIEYRKNKLIAQTQFEVKKNSLFATIDAILTGLGEQFNNKEALFELIDKVSTDENFRNKAKDFINNLKTNQNNNQNIN